MNIILAQDKVNSMRVSEKRCIQEIYGDSWTSIENPKNFGKKFKKAVKNEQLLNIRHIGIRNHGRCDEYERI